MTQEEMIIKIISDGLSTRLNVAAIYAGLIITEQTKLDWERINKAIIARWSNSALIFIKESAWSKINHILHLKTITI